MEFSPWRTLIETWNDDNKTRLRKLTHSEAGYFFFAYRSRTSRTRRTAPTISTTTTAARMMRRLETRMLVLVMSSTALASQIDPTRTFSLCGGSRAEGGSNLAVEKVTALLAITGQTL